MMNSDDRQSLARKAQAELAKRELSRRHLLDFICYLVPGYQVNWHHRQIADALEAVERGQIDRLMISVPPRHGKSELASKHFPAWFMGKHPEREVVLASYSAELAVDFGRSTRNIMQTKEYGNLFDTRLAQDSKSAGRWNTAEGGGYVAAGIGGAITGRGAHILIIDDPVKNREEADSVTFQERNITWYTSTAYTRLAPGGAIIVIATRWSERDLSGYLLNEEKNGGDKWHVVNLPAIAIGDETNRKMGEALWPTRYGVEALERIKTNLGTRDWLALYQQNPVDNLSSEFRTDWFRSVTPDEARQNRVARYLTIDTAISEKDGDDFTGMVDNQVDHNNVWHLSARRLRVNPAELINMLFLLHEERHYTAIGIEEGIYTKAIQPFLKEAQEKRNIWLPIKMLKHGGRAKVVRIRGIIPRYEAGKIKHVKGECADLEEELLRFPSAAHDDVADAAAYQDQIVQSGGPNQADDEMARMIARNRASQSSGR